MKREKLLRNLPYRGLGVRLAGEGVRLIFVRRQFYYNSTQSTEYVSFVVTKDGERLWGHYFIRKEEALKDFKGRQKGGGK